MPPRPLYSVPHVPLWTLVLPFCSLTFPSSPYVFTLQRYIDFWAFCSLCWHPQNASGVWTFSPKKEKCLVQYLFCPLPVIDPFFFHCRHTVAVSAALGSPPSWTLPPPKTCSVCFSGTASLKHAAGSTSSRGHKHKHLGNSFFRLITGKKTWKQTNKIKKTLRDTAGWEFCQSLLGHWNLVPLCVSVADGTRAHGDSGEQRRAWMPSINDCSRPHVGPAWTECSVRPLDECVHSVVCERCSLYSLSSFKSVPDFHRKPSENTPQTDVHV